MTTSENLAWGQEASVKYISVDHAFFPLLGHVDVVQITFICCFNSITILAFKWEARLDLVPNIII